MDAYKTARTSMMSLKNSKGVCLFYLILVDDLQTVVMDVLLVDQRDIF